MLNIQQWNWEDKKKFNIYNDYGKYNNVPIYND